MKPDSPFSQTLAEAIERQIISEATDLEMKKQRASRASLSEIWMNHHINSDPTFAAFKKNPFAAHVPRKEQVSQNNTSSQNSSADRGPFLQKDSLTQRQQRAWACLNAVDSSLPQVFSLKIIKKIWRKFAMQYHPDHNGDRNIDVFVKIQEAVQTLSAAFNKKAA